MCKIEKNISYEDFKRKRPRKGLSGIMQKLEVGDSILLPSSKRDSLYQIANRLGIKIKTAKETGIRVRVWRTE